MTTETFNKAKQLQEQITAHKVYIFNLEQDWNTTGDISREIFFTNGMSWKTIFADMPTRTYNLNRQEIKIKIAEFQLQFDAL